jgi:hypothetical protein
MWLFQKPKIYSRSVKYFYAVHLLELFTVFLILLSVLLLFISETPYSSFDLVFKTALVLFIVCYALRTLIVLITGQELRTSADNNYTAVDGGIFLFIYDALSSPTSIRKVSKNSQIFRATLSFLFIILFFYVLKYGF